MIGALNLGIKVRKMKRFFAAFSMRYHSLLCDTLLNPYVSEYLIKNTVYRILQ